MRGEYVLYWCIVVLQGKSEDSIPSLGAHDNLFHVLLADAEMSTNGDRYDVSEQKHLELNYRFSRTMTNVVCYRDGISSINRWRE